MKKLPAYALYLLGFIALVATHHLWFAVPIRPLALSILDGLFIFLWVWASATLYGKFAKL